MVVSAAVTGIPIIEELESARPTARKPAGAKSGGQKGASTTSTSTTAKQNQSKGKSKGLDPLSSKLGATKDSKTSKPQASSSSSKPGTSNNGAKRNLEQSNTVKSSVKSTGKGLKQESATSKRGGTGAGRGRR